MPGFSSPSLRSIISSSMMFWILRTISRFSFPSMLKSVYSRCEPSWTARPRNTSSFCPRSISFSSKTFVATKTFRESVQERVASICTSTLNGQFMAEIICRARRQALFSSWRSSFGLSMAALYGDPFGRVSSQPRRSLLRMRTKWSPSRSRKSFVRRSYFCSGVSPR